MNLQFNLITAAKISTSNQPSIHAFYINSATVENIYNNVLKPRWEKLNKIDRIKHIRSFHQFDVRLDHAIVYKHTSNSIDYMIFMYKINDDFQSSIQQVHTSNKIDVGIKNQGGKSFSSRSTCGDYEPAFSSTTFYVSRSTNTNSCNTTIQYILLLLRQNPTVGKQEEVYLNHELFNNIKSICKEF
ncbi:unnamed protein product [Rotaria sordida]|uniref:Uncharacterized protein n=1 Tax=Rotaria sordida TaxID=392033 RepID=A0A818VQN4_9BILA|nr:unnamed protein product [Rotaria sordida]CAF0962829.1 unnamed protein product [Rotaria sordida]CAF3714499.1 unnamed protein product [Rotaria sordida]CAF3764066.1 unnamed protein product [Rotaria sordida]